MKFLDKLKKIIKSKSSQKTLKTKRLFNPNRGWIILICFFALSFLAVSSVGYFVYKKIERGDFFAIEENESLGIRTINKVQLGNLVEELQERQENFNLLLESEINYIDPSL